MHAARTTALDYNAHVRRMLHLMNMFDGNTGKDMHQLTTHDRAIPNTTFQLMPFKSPFSVVQRIFSSSECCACLAEGLRFDCGQYGFFAVFAVNPFADLRFPAVIGDCTTAEGSGTLCTVGR